MSADQSPVDALRIRYTRSEQHPNGKPVREIERDRGLTEGALANARKRARAGKVPTLVAMERWAAALGAPLDEVSRAFALECGVDLAAELSAEEDQLVADYRALPEGEQRMIRDLARLAADRARSARSEPDSRGPYSEPLTSR
ncbi:transcriptional regulator with XRE-family HTH domain [Crossiella equi]|uniref:Transcriptional regulator with XRE-family HTH domain n=1 Tax=Crossiella equi TaxID=130796 RepID=A0ABS5ATV4_9PSEU|nr:hypothetical protein [Crossiella equi]MBP2479125.1 transcriptional regulator with XRE-family HTH domain [Crossiella equi]